MDTLSEEDKKKLNLVKAKFGGEEFSERIFDIIANDPNIKTVDDLINKFFEATTFKNGKGVLSTLNEYGLATSNEDGVEVNRKFIEGQSIHLSQLITGKSLYDSYLKDKNNTLGKKMSSIIMHDFIQQIDQQFQQHSSLPQDILDDRDANKGFLNEKMKEDQVSFSEFASFVLPLFTEGAYKGTERVQDEQGKRIYRQKFSPSNIEKYPEMKEIYHSLDIPIGGIITALKNHGDITQKQYDTFYQGKRGALEQNIDCLITGDVNKLKEKVEGRVELNRNFQDFIGNPLPNYQNLYHFFPADPDENKKDEKGGPLRIPPKTTEERNSVIAQYLDWKRENIITKNSLLKDDPECKEAINNEFKKVQDKITTLLDVNQKEINFETSQGDFTLQVDKKINNGKGLLDMEYTITIPEEGEEALSKEILFKQYFKVQDKTGEKSIGYGYTVEMNHSEEKKTGKLSNTIDKARYPHLTIPDTIQQKINQHGEHNLLFLLDEAGTTILDAYTESELKESDIVIKERKISLAGQDLQDFLNKMLVLQLKGLDLLDTVDEERQKNYKDILDKEKEDETNKTPEEAERQQSEFLEYFKGLSGYPFDKHPEGNTEEEKAGLKKGTRLRINTGWKSELPPMNAAGTQRIQAEIKEVTKEGVKIELHGGELGLGKKLEGKTLTRPKNKERRENTCNAFATHAGSGAKIIKLPPPTKDLQGCMTDIKDSNLFGNYWGQLGIKISFEGDKIVFNSPDENTKGKKNVVKCFGISAEIEDKDIKKQHIHYDIEYLPNKKIKVTSKYLSKKKKDGEDEWKKMQYEQTMDYNSFLIFIADKGLKPTTEAEKSVEENNNKDLQKNIKARLPHKWGEFFSIKSIFEAGKQLWKKVDSMLDEHQKQQSDKVGDMAVRDWGLLRKFGSVAGAFGRTSGKEAVAKAEIEYRNDRDNLIWKKIQGWIDRFDKDPDTGGIISNDDYLSQYFGTGGMVARITGEVPINGEDGKPIKGKDGKEQYIKKALPNPQNPEERYMTAAAILTNIKGGGGPYARMDHLKFTGHWVKILMGPEHHTRFMALYNEARIRLEKNKGKHKVEDSRMMDLLANAEMQYIINNLDERGGDNNGVFGYQKGVPDRRKGWLSIQFVKELDTRYNEYNSDAKLKENADAQMKTPDFDYAYEEFQRFSFSGRPGKGIPRLQAMAAMAKLPEQFAKVQMCILFLLTSGYLKYLPSSYRIFVERLSRSIAFTPGITAIEPDHPERVGHLLNVITKGDFQKDTKWKFSNFINDGEPKERGFYGNYFKTFKKFREKDPTITNKFRSENIAMLPTTQTDGHPDKIILYFQDRDNEVQTEDMNKEVLENGRLAAFNPLGKTKGVFDQFSRYSGGKFSPNLNADEEQARQDFWGAVKEGIEGCKNKPGGLEFLIKKFSNWFSDEGLDQTGREKIVKTIKTIQLLKQQKTDDLDTILGKGTNKSIAEPELRRILDFMITGRIFAQKGKSPPPELKDAVGAFTQAIWEQVDTIDDTIVTECFKVDKSFFRNDKTYYYINQEDANGWIYNTPYGKEEKEKRSIYNSEKDSYINDEMNIIFSNLKGGNLDLHLGESKGRDSTIENTIERGRKGDKKKRKDNNYDEDDDDEEELRMAA